MADTLKIEPELRDGGLTHFPLCVAVYLANETIEGWLIDTSKENLGIMVHGAESLQVGTAVNIKYNNTRQSAIVTTLTEMGHQLWLVGLGLCGNEHHENQSP